MDASNVDHSDSDSGDSWTILDYCASYGEEAPEIELHNEILQKAIANSSIDKDDDTDGISILSDSEPESHISCEMIPDLNMEEQSCPAEISPSEFLSYHPLPSKNDHEASMTNGEDILGDNTGKHKTYVHRRNKRLSTVLNIIMLGSVITAAGVAIGHMWGAKNECATHVNPSINKILSNLYKLQEENTYLRNKLKELTVINSLQMQQKKFNNGEKLSFKQLRCKKIYEGPLDNKSTEKMTKCIDNEINMSDNNVGKHLVQPQYEKDFERDVTKLKHIYQQNRSWLDKEVAKRIKHEENISRKNVNNRLSSISEEQKVLQDDNPKIQSDEQNDEIKMNINADPEVIPISSHFQNNSTDESVLRAQKVSYADSLKSDQQPHKVEKRETNAVKDNDHRDNFVKRKMKYKDVEDNYANLSEEDTKKDDRYIGLKHKQEKKKRDRQKLHKKQKRRNKYEQWEMKGGYMKDYDESTTSFQDSETIMKKPDGNQLSNAFEITHTNQLLEADSIENINLNIKPKKTSIKNLERSSKLNTKTDDTNWYDKRAVLRREARKKLEHELFGDTSPSNAGWYFRRMQKREQCRAKSDNSTYKRFYKHNMNYKTKN